jgi:dual specificity MAP kinase phosphatase
MIIVILILVIIIAILVWFVTFKFLKNRPTQIMEGLWLVNEKTALNKTFLEKNKIRLIINCTKDSPFIDANDIEKVRVPVNDTSKLEDQELMLQNLPGAIKIIDSFYDKGEGILIHCKAGMQRSATVTLCYLMYKKGLDKQKAKSFIRKKRFIVFLPSNNFNHAQNLWENLVERIRRNEVQIE